MSWLGSGLSQITGQISSFTKEVLTEGTEEVDDHVTELRLAKARQAELESHCQAQRNENERLRAINGELNDKLHSAELQISAISNEYRHKLQKSQEEVKQLKQQHNELIELQRKMPVTSPSPAGSAATHHSHGTFGGADEHDFHDVISGQHEIYKLRLELNHWKSLANSQKFSTEDNVGASTQENTEQLQQRILELEGQLSSEVDQHQRELAALQDAHNQKLYTLRQQHKQQLQRLQEGDAGEGTEVARLNQLLSNLQQSNAQVTEEKEALLQKVEELQKEVEKFRDQLNTSHEKGQQDVFSDKTDPNFGRTLREGRLPSSTPLTSNFRSRYSEPSKDDSYSESLVLDFSEVSMQNENLSEQVKLLQNQIQDYQAEIIRFDEIKVDWEAEKEALENVLLQLRQKLHAKEEALAKKNEEINSIQQNFTKAKNAAGDEMGSADTSRIEMLESDLTMKTAKLMEALERMEQQDAEIDKLNQLLREMEESQLEKSQDKSLQADIELRAEQLHEALMKVKASENELRKLKIQLEEKESALEDLTIDKEAMEASLEELDVQNQQVLQHIISKREELQAENELLKQKMAALENSSSKQEEPQLSTISDEDVDKEIESLKEQLRKEQLHQQEMKEKYDKAAHSLNDLHMDKKDLEKSNSSLTEKVKELSSKIKDLRTEKSQLQKSYENLGAELNLTKEELNRSLQSSEQDDLRSKIGDMQAQLENSQLQCETFRENVSKLESQLESLQSQLAEVTEERDKLAEELKDTSLSISQSEEWTKNLSAQMSDLSNQKEVLESHKLSLQQDLEQMEQKMQEQRQHYETFIEQLNQAKQLDESGLQQKVEQLAKDCYDKDHLISELESTVTGLQADLQDQKEMLQTTLSGQGSIKDILTEKETEISKLLVEKQSIMEAVEEKGHQLTSLQAEVERLQDIENKHRSCLEELERHRVHLDSVQQPHNQYEGSENNDPKMLDVVTDLESEIASLNESLEELSKLLSEKDKEIHTLKKTLSDKDLQLIELENKLSEKAKLLDKSHTTIATYDKNLEDLKLMLHNKDSELEDMHKRGNDSQNKTNHHSNGDVNENNNTLEDVILQNGEWDNKHDENDYETLHEEFEKLRNIAAQKDSVITELRVNNSALLKMLEDKSLQLHGDKTLVEIHKLENDVRSLRKEKEQIMSILNEKSRECSSLKSEVHKLMNVVSAEKNAISKLQQDNNELMKTKADPNSDMMKETVKRLSQIIRDKDLEIESLMMKTQTLLQVLQGNSQEGVALSTLVQERDNLLKQVALFQQDREQIIQALNQKHQESVSFHAEVQRLTTINNNDAQELETLKHQYTNLSKQYEDKQQTLLKVQNDLLNYKHRYTELESKMKDIETERRSTPPSMERDTHSVSPPPSANAEEQEQLGSMVRELRKNLQQKDEQCREKDSVIIKYGAKIKDIEDQILKKDTLIAEKSKVITDMNVKLRELKETIREKELEISGQKKKVENLTFQMQGLQSDISDLQAQVEQLNDQRSRFQSEIIQMKEANNRLNVTVGERDLELSALKEKVATLTQLATQHTWSGEEKGAVDQRMAETEVMQKQAQIFQQERDQAMTSLRAKQMDLQQMQHQYSQLEEREKKLVREVERLRGHLLQIEDGYTQEALAAEEREKDLRNRLAIVEEMAHSQSSAVQTANALTSQQLDCLQKQLVEVSEERDSLLHQLSSSQEQANQYATNLANLQMVLEQFTQEREQQMSLEIERYLQQLSSCKFERDQLRHHSRQLQVELEETKEALEAAHRLSEQLDRKEAAISALREEVQMREAQLQKAEEDMNRLRTTNQGKVDKALIKNLFMGYFHLPSNKRGEAVRLIGKILDFSEDEMLQVDGGGGGWLTGMTGMWRGLRGSGQHGHSTPGSSPSTPLADRSFSELFVKFLEQESTPTVAARLPADQMIQEQQMKQQQKHHTPFNPFAVPVPASSASGTRSFVTADGSFISLPGMNDREGLLMAPLTPTLPTFNPIPAAATGRNTGRSSVNSSGRSTPASSAILKDVLEKS